MDDEKLSRGVWRHGRIKTFLTRGVLKSVFRPLLYKTEDEVHKSFLDTLNPISELDTTDAKIEVVVLWLVYAPKDLFERIFVEDDRNESYLPAVKYANMKNGHLCAHYTQAFVLWHIEQFLNNVNEYQQTIGLTIDDFEYVLEHVYGKKNLTIDYLNQLREEFDLNKLKVDPRDWGIIYVNRILDLLVNDEEIIQHVISEWDRDIIQKMSFITWINDFFVEGRNLSVDIMNR